MFKDVTPPKAEVKAHTENAFSKLQLEFLQTQRLQALKVLNSNVSEGCKSDWRIILKSVDRRIAVIKGVA